MRKLTNWFVWLVIGSALLISCSSDDTRPNIIFIMVDDLGKEWVSCYGADDINTPNVDLLAEQGTRFDNVYCMPQCTPTRLTLLTGQYPYAHGWVNHWDVPRWGGGAHYDEEVNPCLPLAIKDAGYSTCIAGKWQIDDFRVEPDALSKIGFDDWCMWTGGESGVPASSERYHNPYLFTKEGSKSYPSAFGPDLINDFVCDFIRHHKEEPMFVYYPMVLTHTPLIQPPGSVDTSKVGMHKAMVTYADMLLGRIMTTLEENGLDNNTLLIWTTDNGTTRGITGSLNGASVQGGKGLTIESGINVPFVARWPGNLEGNENSAALIDFTDLYPTFLEIIQSDATIDKSSQHGVSFASVLNGKTKASNRDWIMAMGGGNHASLTENGVENQYVFRDRVFRDHQYKLWVDTEGKPAKLFNLNTDPYEKENIMDRAGEEGSKAVAKFLDALAKMPKKDSDPKYRPNPAQVWDVPVTQPSEVWKRTQ